MAVLLLQSWFEEAALDLHAYVHYCTYLLSK